MKWKWGGAPGRQSEGVGVIGHKSLYTRIRDGQALVSKSKSAVTESAGPIVRGRATTGQAPFCPPVTIAPPTDTRSPPIPAAHARVAVSVYFPARARPPGDTLASPQHAALARPRGGDVRIKLFTSPASPPLPLISTASPIKTRRGEASQVRLIPPPPFPRALPLDKPTWA